LPELQQLEDAMRGWPDRVATSDPRWALVSGVTALFLGVGVISAMVTINSKEAHDLWPLGLIPTFLGAGFLLVYDSSAMDESDEALAAACRAEDSQPFDLLVRRYQERVFRLAMSILGAGREHAEEVAQDAFLQAYRAMDRFRGDARWSRGSQVELQ